MPSKKNPKQNSARKKAKKPTLWKFILTGLKRRKALSHPRMKISRKTLSPRTIGKKPNRKIHLTIIGLVAIIAIGLSLSPLQDYFKASILSTKQKNTVVTSAQTRLGVPYQLGGQGPNGYDCSGLVGTVMKEALNINLPRMSRDQYSVGREIAFANVGIGDLVFFKTYGSTISHVGIVSEVRNGRVKMINANSYTGKVEEEVVEGYWLQTYVGAREITEATKDISAPAQPDVTYIAPSRSESSDQYNNYFPPSERGDPRIKVGAATIEENNTSTHTISDINLEGDSVTSNTNSTPSPTPIATPSPTPTPVETRTPEPLLTISPDLLPVTPSPEPTPTEEPSPFSDVGSNNRAYEAIQKLVGLNIISGYEDGTFRPNDPVTRAELVKMVYKALNKRTNSNKAAPFTDMNNHPLSKYVTSAYNDKIIKGYPDKTFRPQNPVTRAEGAKIILKAFDIESETPRRDYEDMDEKNELASYLGYLTNNRLLKLVNNMIYPGKALTRAEVATIVASLLD